MSDDTMTPPIGASEWERDMYAHLTNHARQEGVLLEEYVRAAESTGSKAFAYIVNLLADDERRHHRFFADLASSLKTDAELDPADPAVPRLDLNRADREAVLAATRQLIEREEADAAELKRLRKEMRDFEDTTLWGLLVDLMQRDTEKHQAILRFVERHAKSDRH